MSLQLHKWTSTKCESNTIFKKKCKNCTCIKIYPCHWTAFFKFPNFKGTKKQLFSCRPILGKDWGVWQKIDNRHSSKSIPTVVTRWQNSYKHFKPTWKCDVILRVPQWIILSKLLEIQRRLKLIWHNGGGIKFDGMLFSLRLSWIHNVCQKYTSGKKSAKYETPYDQASQQIFPGQKRQIFCNKKGSSPNPKGRQNFAIGIIITFLIIPPPTHHRNWHHHPHQGEVKYNWDPNIRRSMPSTSRNSATLRSGMVVPCSPMGDRVLLLFVPATHPSVLKYTVRNTNTSTNTIPTHLYWPILFQILCLQNKTFLGS